MPFDEFHLLPGDTPEPRDGPRPRRADHRRRAAALAAGRALALSESARPEQLRIRPGVGGRRSRSAATASSARRRLALRRRGDEAMAGGRRRNRPWSGRPRTSVYTAAARRASGTPGEAQFNAFKIELAQHHRPRPGDSGRAAMNEKSVGSGDRPRGRPSQSDRRRPLRRGFPRCRRPPWRHCREPDRRGRVQAIDAGAARQAPGVAAVVTHENMPKLSLPQTDFFKGGKPSEDPAAACRRPHLLRRPISGGGRGRYAGAARFAASLVKVAYADRAAARSSTTRLAEQRPNRQSFGQKLQYHRGDVDQELAGPAAVTIDETYTTPIETHNPMEMSATLAVWEGDRLTVYDATQWVKGTQAILAEVFGLPRENVRVLCPFLGGGFGCKGFTSAYGPGRGGGQGCGPAGQAAANTRSNVRRHGHRPSTEQKLTVAATKDGMLTAIRHFTTQDFAGRRLYGDVWRQHQVSCTLVRTSSRPSAARQRRDTDLNARTRRDARHLCSGIST